MSDNSINCWIYKSSRKEEMYLYLPAENAFDRLPEELLSSFGKPLFVLSIELNPARKLARVDTASVITALEEEGYFLQMPPELKPELYFGNES
ncbi:MAG: YcgL domain-containing protein [Pseudomonadota bacterium]